VCYIPEVSIKTEKISLHFYDLCGKADTFFLSHIAREEKGEKKVSTYEYYIKLIGTL
jgi:hypothetical protein